MRVDPHVIGSILHVTKRGARGMPIVRNGTDRWHFIDCLFYLNDEHQDENWRQSIADIPRFDWPKHWPRRKPLVDVLAWTLMSNHFHLILREKENGGISAFMRRLCGSMSARFNAKYGEKGSLFQGSYKGRLVSDDADLRWLVSYVMVKNTFELYPGGLARAVKNFEDAWRWGLEYPFSSLTFYGSETISPLMPTTDNILLEIVGDTKKFKKESQEIVKGYLEMKASKKHEDLALE